MGLDMYAYFVPKGEEPNEHNQTEMQYWRKFNALHGWMEDLYRERGGEAEHFNCIPLKLEEADLDRLLNDMKQDKLAPREGFFFGEQEIRMADFVSAYGFVGLAKSLIAMGKDIYYDSWW